MSTHEEAALAAAIARPANSVKHGAQCWLPLAFAAAVVVLLDGALRIVLGGSDVALDWMAGVWLAHAEQIRGMPVLAAPIPVPPAIPWIVSRLLVWLGPLTSLRLAGQLAAAGLSLGLAVGVANSIGWPAAAGSAMVLGLSSAATTAYANGDSRTLLASGALLLGTMAFNRYLFRGARGDLLMTSAALGIVVATSYLVAAQALVLYPAVLAMAAATQRQRRVALVRGSRAAGQREIALQPDGSVTIDHSSFARKPIKRVDRR